MATVFEEEPFAAVVSASYLDTTCSKCFAWIPVEGSQTNKLKQVNLMRCAGCKMIYYCEKACQKADWKDHKLECKLLRDCSGVPSHDVRLVSRILRKDKAEPDFKAFNERTYASLPDTFDQDMSSEGSALAMKDVYREVALFMGKYTPDFETVGHAISKKAIHSFGIHDGMFCCAWRGTGLYIGLSAHQHYCRADCFVISDGAKLVIRTRDTSGICLYTPDLSISFNPVGLIRISEKRKGKQYECNCNDCPDEEKDRKDRSGRSNCCLNGWFTVENPLCSECGKEVSQKRQKMVHDANEEIGSVVDYHDGLPHLQFMTGSTHIDDWLKVYKKYKDVLTTFNLNLVGFYEVLYPAMLPSAGPQMAMEFVDGCLPIMRTFPPSVMAAAYFCQRSMIYMINSAVIAPQKVSESIKEAKEMVHIVFGEKHEITRSFEQTVAMYKMFKRP